MTILRRFASRPTIFLLNFFLNVETSSSDLFSTAVVAVDHCLNENARHDERLESTVFAGFQTSGSFFVLFGASVQ